MSQDPTGIVLVDKPKGITSFGVLNKIKKKFGIIKIGHAGTLDPDATGLLIVLLGAATKLQRYITDDVKSYSGEIQLGISTSTGDTTSEVTQRMEIPPLGQEFLDSAVKKFIGPHLQMPPAFSAIKKDGVRAYKLARQGEDVKLEPREVTLYECTVRLAGPDKINYHLVCSKGFYVRSFARDFSEALETIGVTHSIRRESSAGVSVSSAIEMDLLIESGELPILPVTDFLSNMERILCSEEEYLKLLLGRNDILLSLSGRAQSDREVLLLVDNRLAGVLSPVHDGKRKVEFLVPGLVSR